MRPLSLGLLAAAASGAVVWGCGSVDGSAPLETTDSQLCSAGQIVADDADYSAAPGVTVLWTASATCEFVNPEFQFWVRPPAGSFAVVRDWDTSDTFSWDTTSLGSGRYDWQVWVREGGSTANYETYQARSFVLSASDPCTSVSVSSTPALGGAVGDPVTLSFAAECGASSPEYLVYHLPAGGSTWSVLNNYSASSSYEWDTTGEPQGRHWFQVWVRAQGSARGYEAYGGLSYSLSDSPACSSATLGFQPSSGASVGDVVVLQATAASCTSPTFQYWYLPPGGTWSVLQDWSSSGTLNWNTAGDDPGEYKFQVWARQSGSIFGYETFKDGLYSLGSAEPGAFRTIGAGTSHSCQVLSDATLRCWGYNLYGQLGDATNTSSSSAVPVVGVSNGLALATGYQHSCVLRSNGGVACWGLNSSGQLGDGSYSNRSSPQDVSGISSAAWVTAGTAHSCATQSDGTVRCWGYNSQGQLGNGAISNSATAVAVSGISTAIQVVAGYYHSCALLSNGTVQCWGLNDRGQLGDGSTTNSLVPVTVSGLSGVKALAAASSHTCAALEDGTVECWGANNDGVLGNGTTDDSSVPVPASGVAMATSIATGPYHTCIGNSDGSAGCWGLNVYGELGDGTSTSSTTVVPVSNLTTVDTIAVGHHHSCATLVDGSAECWGYNGLGQVGDGTHTNRAEPTAVVDN